MPIQMIKHNGKMVPAKQIDGKWVPDENAQLEMGADGEMRIAAKTGNSEHEPAKPSFLDRMFNRGEK